MLVSGAGIGDRDIILHLVSALVVVTIILLQMCVTKRIITFGARPSDSITFGAGPSDSTTFGARPSESITFGSVSKIIAQTAKRYYHIW